MPEIQPFRALRYSKGATAGKARLVCPPYDVISPALQRELYEVSPYNAVRLELPMEPDPYKAAAERIALWLQSGVLARDEEPAIYPCFQTYTDPGGEEHTRKGFFCALRLYEFSEAQVLPHERTLSGPKADRLNLFRKTGVNISSIFGLYADEELDADRLINRFVAENEPVVDEEFHGVRNRMWKITDRELIARVQQVVLERKVYIADGHHRYETGVAYRTLRASENPGHTGQEPYNFILTYLANTYDEGLLIFPLHRMVHGLQGFDQDVFMERLGVDFSIHQLHGRAELHAWLDAHASRHAFGMVTSRGIFGISLKGLPEPMLNGPVPVPLQQLDVVVLHELVLHRMLGISPEAMREQANLVYTEHDHEVFEAVGRGDIQVGFIVKPTTVRQVMDIAAAGEVMPQKSTFFYPKIMTGLLFHEL